MEGIDPSIPAPGQVLRTLASRVADCLACYATVY